MRVADSRSTANITLTSQRRTRARAFDHSERQASGANVQNFSDSPGKPYMGPPIAAVGRSVDRGERGGSTSGSFLAVPLLEVRSCMLSAVIGHRALLTVRQSVVQDRS